MTRNELLIVIEQLLHERLARLEGDIIAGRSDLGNDTKSSAGDKHEVGREMVQQELDKLEAQRAKLRMLLHELNGTPTPTQALRVEHGSVVCTDQGWFYLAVGVGAIELHGERCFVLSPAAPLAKALLGTRVGDQVVHERRSYRILALAS
jgi:hypothetical protein